MWGLVLDWVVSAGGESEVLRSCERNGSVTAELRLFFFFSFFEKGGEGGRGGEIEMEDVSCFAV